MVVSTFRRAFRNAATAAEGDIAACPIVSVCGAFRPQAEAVPGINRAAHAIP
jgi:hypothetical protein